MTPGQLRKLIEEEGRFSDATAAVMVNLAPKLLKLWEAAERYREDVRNLDDWLRVNAALQALEEA